MWVYNRPMDGMGNVWGFGLEAHVYVYLGGGCSYDFPFKQRRWGCSNLT